MFPSAAVLITFRWPATGKELTVLQVRREAFWRFVDSVREVPAQGLPPANAVSLDLPAALPGPYPSLCLFRRFQVCKAFDQSTQCILTDPLLCEFLSPSAYPVQSVHNIDQSPLEYGRLGRPGYPKYQAMNVGPQARGEDGIRSSSSLSLNVRTSSLSIFLPERWH